MPQQLVTFGAVHCIDPRDLAAVDDLDLQALILAVPLTVLCVRDVASQAGVSKQLSDSRVANNHVTERALVTGRSLTSTLSQWSTVKKLDPTCRQVGRNQSAQCNGSFFG